MQKYIAALSPSGGGDAPEAVFDGLRAAGVQAWRTHSRRTAILIGAAPPHGFATRGNTPHGECRCGLTADKPSPLLEGQPSGL